MDPHIIPQRLPLSFGQGESDLEEYLCTSAFKQMAKSLILGVIWLSPNCVFSRCHADGRIPVTRILNLFHRS